MKLTDDFAYQVLSVVEEIPRAAWCPTASWPPLSAARGTPAWWPGSCPALSCTAIILATVW